jgi:biotin operon repressor
MTDHQLVLSTLSSKASTLRDIARATGLSRRAVEQAVQTLRLEGAPLVSDSDGIRISRDPAEVRACAKRLRSRAIHQMETASALEKAADQMPMTLWGSA